MAEATVSQEGLFQKTSQAERDVRGVQKDAAGEISAPNAGISVDDTKEIEAQIAELALKNRIILKDDMGKPLKKEMAFPIVVNLALFGAAAIVLFFLMHYFNQQERGIGRGRAFSSVEGELINQLREDSENIISGKEREIASVRQELSALELQRQRELADFDAQLELREAAFLEQLRKDREDEQARLAVQGLSGSEINERLRNFERERMERYRGQLAEERNAIAKDFEERESQYHNSIRALNDERRLVQTEIQRQQQFYLQLQETNAAVRQELEQALSDMQRMRETQMRDANEEALIVGMFNKIQGDFQSRRFGDAMTDANNLTRALQDMPGASARRTADIALAASLARMARLEMENQRLQNADAAPRVALEAEQQRASTRIAELQEALNEANRQAAGREAALQTANQRAVAERQQLESQHTKNLANAVDSIRQAKRFADNNNTAAAMNAYRQSAGYFGLSAAETAILISGIETLSQNALLDAVNRQSRESDELLTQTESALRNRIIMLEAALTNLRKSDADKQARITQLEPENARLRQQNQQLSAAATANQNTVASRMQDAITQLETENARLRQQNQQLSSAATDQNSASAAAASQMQARITQLETENNKLQESERTLTYNLAAMTDNYNGIKPNSDAYLSLVRAYSVYKNDRDRLSNLERFLNEREVAAVFPGFVDKVRNIADDLTVSVRKESLNTVSSILETALRIQTPATRKLYLEGMKVRYVNDAATANFIEMLIKRL
ncbi:MAG: hypothetical protein LBG43_06385 [Treponema sp.]|jgi:hypothetical protein|nr:hypothetical protein [Treponema sp.]